MDFLPYSIYQKKILINLVLIPPIFECKHINWNHHHQQVSNVYNIFLCPILSFDSLPPFISILPVTILQSPVLHQIHNSLYPCLLRSPSSFPPIWNPLQTSHWQSIFSRPPHVLTIALVYFPQIDKLNYSATVKQAVACAPVTRRARGRSPVGTSFLGGLFSEFILTCKTECQETLGPEGLRISFGQS